MRGKFKRSKLLFMLPIISLGCAPETAEEVGGTEGSGIASLSETADPDGASSGATSAGPTTADEGADADGGSTSALSGQATDATSTTSGDTASGGSTAALDGGSSTGDTICETVLCGDPAQCCEAMQECVQGACLEPCDSGVRCGADGSICCEAGQVCLADSCADPLGPCLDSFDCDPGEFCEPTLGECLPQFDPVACEVVPDFEDIELIEEWSFTDNEIISIPVVADIDGDLVSEVVLNLTQMDGQSWPGGIITVLDGQTGDLELQLPHDPVADTYGAHGRSSIGLTDVDGDGLPDIIYAGRPTGNSSLIYAVDFAGTLLWSSHDPDGSPHAFTVVNGAPSFGNFDADPEAEIVFGASLIDNDGTVVWDEDGNGAAIGTNGNYTGGISAIVDLTSDGYPEIVSGREAWAVDWQLSMGSPAVAVSELWNAGGNDGYPAIADVDVNGDPEVILVASGQVRVLEGETGELWCGIDPTGAMCAGNDALRTQPVAIPGGGIGGPPTVADFDGDGRPEFAAAGGSSYTVYDLFRTGETVEVATGFPMPSPGEVYPRWTMTTQDQSSNATGSSVFDFQGDGAAEVVYADECYMRVYSGADGSVLVQEENSSATIHEYPLVVDVDGDGNSEILVVANDSGSNCTGIPGYTERRGLYVFGDTFDRWVGTRRVWTSHTYHVTNATAQGNAPATENDNWTQPGLNNYRQNVQGEGVFNAPDLAVELSASLAACAEGTLDVVASIRNAGALGVPAGIAVSLYEGQDAMGVLIGTQMTAVPLLPGAVTSLSWSVPFANGDPAMDFFVTVDGVDAAAGVVTECNESNNDDASVSVECQFPG